MCNGTSYALKPHAEPRIRYRFTSGRSIPCLADSHNRDLVREISHDWMGFSGTSLWISALISGPRNFVVRRTR